MERCGDWMVLADGHAEPLERNDAGFVQLLRPNDAVFERKAAPTRRNGRPLSTAVISAGGQINGRSF
jgi:hypothetical protein